MRLILNLAGAFLFFDSTFFSLSAFAEDDAFPIRRVIKFNYVQKEAFVVGLEYNPAQPNFFYVASPDGVISKYDENKADAVWEIKTAFGETEFLETIELSKDGRLLFAAGSNEKIFIFNADTGTALPVNYTTGSQRALPILSHYTSLAISAENNFFAAGDANGHVYVWAFSESTPRAVFKTNGQSIKDLTFDSTGEILTTLTSSEIMIWNVEQKSLLMKVNDVLGVDNFWIEGIYAPAYEPFLVITTFDQTVLFDLSTRKIAKRYPIATSNDGEKGAILKAIVDKDFSNIWQFYKEPLVEKLNAETGQPIQGYIDPTIFSTGGFRIGAYTHIALKPETTNEFIASVFTWDVNIFTGEITASILLRRYQM